MVRPSWTSLDEHGREAFRATVAFLEGRLEERGTVHWALKLRPNDTIKRLALLELVDSPYGRKISEPWRSAWRLIKDSWSSPVVEGHGSSEVYDAQERLIAGDRSGSLVTTIVELVAPRLKIEPFTSLSLKLDKTTKRPKKVEDLLSTRLTSGQLVDIGVLKLGVLIEGPFLVSLAHALDALVATGLDMGRRIGWDGERRLWRLGQLHRVYYVPPSERTDPAYDPDRFHRGIAPSVKLLHTVVSRLVDIDIAGALDFVRRWKLTNSPIHLRLWAALSRDSRVTSSKEVASMLLALWHWIIDVSGTLTIIPRSLNCEPNGLVDLILITKRCSPPELENALPAVNGPEKLIRNMSKTRGPIGPFGNCGGLKLLALACQRTIKPGWMREYRTSQIWLRWFAFKKAS